MPDKRNAPLLVIFWDPVGLILPLIPLPPITKNVVWHNKKLNFTVRICRRLMKRVKRSGVGYLRFLTARTQKKRASRCGAKLVRSSGDSSRSLTKKLSYSSPYSIGFNGIKCDMNFSFLIIFE